MEAIRVNAAIVLPAEALSVAYVRDLEDGGAEAARHVPMTVELRCDLRACEALTPADRARVLAHPEVRADRRGTVRVTASEHKTRGRNLEEARRVLAGLISRALRGDYEAPAEPAEPAGRRPKRRLEGAARTGQGVVIRGRDRR